MSAIDFIRLSLSQLHDHVLEDVADRTPEQLVWQPNPEASNIAFLLMHIVRLEDGVIQRRFKNAPTLWQSEKWYERCGLGAETGITGYSAQQLASLRFSLDDFLPYARKVFAATMDHLSTMSDEELKPEVKLAYLPQVTDVASLFSLMVVGHLWWHLGEILYIKGLQGWRYPL